MVGEPSQHRLTVPEDHPAFAGHFPGAPVLPGVVLLDLALQFAPGACAGVRQIASAKFFSPVLPGESLVFSYGGTASAGLRFDVACGARKVASGTLVLAA